VQEDLREQESPVPFPDGASYASCDATLGTDTVDDLGVFAVTVQVYADEALAIEDYDYFYADAGENNPATDVAGLGQQAFRSLDAFGDPNVIVRDGNALIFCSWVTHVDEQPPDPADIYPALEATLRTTLASLQDT
jgi:hypothetical protein